jgi:hypothetical protein
MELRASFAYYTSRRTYPHLFHLCQPRRQDAQWSKVMALPSTEIITTASIKVGKSINPHRCCTVIFSSRLVFPDQWKVVPWAGKHTNAIYLTAPVVPPHHVAHVEARHLASSSRTAAAWGLLSCSRIASPASARSTARSVCPMAW